MINSPENPEKPEDPTLSDSEAGAFSITLCSFPPSSDCSSDVTSREIAKESHGAGEGSHADSPLVASGTVATK